VAERFYDSFNGGALKGFEEEQSLFVMPADLQGFEANAARWALSTLDERRLGCRPLFLHYPQAQQALADMGELFGPKCIGHLLEPEHQNAHDDNEKGSNGNRIHGAAKARGNEDERAINGGSHLDKDSCLHPVRGVKAAQLVTRMPYKQPQDLPHMLVSQTSPWMSFSV